MTRLASALLALTLTACDPSPTNIADKIAAHAGGRVTFGGGKFVNVELNGRDQARCDSDQRWVRDNIKQPPDCVRVKCTLADGSEDSIVSYDGYWGGLQGGGYFPKCAK